MTKYRTSSYYMTIDIDAIEITRETEKSVWYVTEKGNERKELKKSSYHNWFDSFDEAKTFLIDQKKKRVENLRRQLEVAKSELGNIKGLKEKE